ncbi:hypothetical protein ACQPXH_24560 [Nocardia sp. CA-135953]|uniref:hypothetical protein n=1 Tax=Nocardia sp. CA-135953 TaxID=3239978 RepID=UPI003D9643F8
MTEQKPLNWTAGEIAEDESPHAGVGDVIEKSYGYACPTCGHDMNSVCDQCASEAAV